MTTEAVRVIRPQRDAGSDTVQTTGMQRQELLAPPGAWVGIVRTASGVVADWHHHGDYETYGYVISGKVLFEFGPGGGEAVEAEAGDVFQVPKNAVHRESNPGEEEQVLLIVRVGTGVPVLNVDGPAR